MDKRTGLLHLKQLCGRRNSRSHHYSRGRGYNMQLVLLSIKKIKVLKVTHSTSVLCRTIGIFSRSTQLQPKLPMKQEIMWTLVLLIPSPNCCNWTRFQACHTASGDGRNVGPGRAWAVEDLPALGRRDGLADGLSLEQTSPPWYPAPDVLNYNSHIVPEHWLLGAVGRCSLITFGWFRRFKTSVETVI